MRTQRLQKLLKLLKHNERKRYGGALRAAVALLLSVALCLSLTSCLGLDLGNLFGTDTGTSSDTSGTKDTSETPDTSGSGDTEPDGCEHDFGLTDTVAATCTGEGYELYTCSLCGTTEKRNTVPELGHDYLLVESSASCSAEGGYSIYECTRCGDRYEDRDPATAGHVPGAWTRVTDPDCEHAGLETAVCSACGETLTRELSRLGHEIIYLLPPTGGDAAVYCTRCGGCDRDDVDETWIPVPSGHSVYGYESLADAVPGDAEIGKLLQRIYVGILLRMIPIQSGLVDPGLQTFHMSTGDEQKYVVAELQYAEISDNRETAEKLAIRIFNALRGDSPTFYWLYKGYIHDDTRMTILMNEAFADRMTRIEKTGQLEKEIAAICALAGSKGSAPDYDRAAIVSHALADRLTYAYDANGQPSDTVEAHSVLGLIDGRKTVCEGYAQLLQTALNRIGIPCIFVSGVSAASGSEVPHAWNMINLQGDWYWADLTFDDGTAGNVEYRMRYFGMPNAEFLQSHVPHPTDSTESLYPLPEVPDGLPAICPVTLVTAKNGEDGNEERTSERYISIDAAFAAMEAASDPDAAYTLVLDGTLSTDLPLTDPFVMAYRLPAGTWPVASSITFEGTEAVFSEGNARMMAGKVAECNGNTDITLRSDLILRGFMPEGVGTLNVGSHSVTVEGEIVRFDLSIVGDAGSSLTLDAGYMTVIGTTASIRTAELTLNGYAEARGTLAPTATFSSNGILRLSGTLSAKVANLNDYAEIKGSLTADECVLSAQTDVYGTVEVGKLVMNDSARLVCDGGYSVRASELSCLAEAQVFLRDKITAGGQFRLGRVGGSETSRLIFSLSILDAQYYPTVVITSPVGVDVDFILDSETVVPGSFTGTLLELTGGMQSSSTLNFRLRGQTGATWKPDGAGRYTFVH